MDTRRLVGRNLRRLRLAQGISQEELAFRASIDRVYMSELERGRRNPSLLVLTRLAKALGVTLNDLVSAEGSAKALPKNLPRGRILR
jgi:transcriptional regulator with XRE-family HTH domain